MGALRRIEDLPRSSQHRRRTTLASVALLVALLVSTAAPSLSQGEATFPQRYTLHFTSAGPGSPSTLAADDGRFEVTVETPEAGDHTLLVSVYDASPAHAPPAPTAPIRYVELGLEDADGAPVEATSAALRLRVPASELAAEDVNTSELYLAGAAPAGAWKPLRAEVSEGVPWVYVGAPLEGAAFVTLGTDRTPPGVRLGTYHRQVSSPTPLDVTALDDVGVVQVRLEVDGVERQRSDEAPWMLVLDPTGLDEGDHIARVVAVDVVGNEGVASWGFVVGQRTVDPEPPVVHNEAVEPRTPMARQEAGEADVLASPWLWFTLGAGVLLAIGMVVLGLRFGPRRR